MSSKLSNSLVVPCAELLEARLMLSGDVLPLSAATPAMFVDADGDVVTVKLSGLGEGTVTLANAGDSDIELIDLSGTTGASSLTITVKKEAGLGTTAMGGLISDGPMKAIKAAKVDLLGLLSPDGVAEVTLGAIDPADARTSVAVTFGAVADALFQSDTPIKSLTVAQWLDTDATADMITAPWMGKLTASGRRASATLPALPGDFQASVTLDPTGLLVAPRLTLGTVKITGSLTGAAWDITGDVGTIQVVGTTDNLTLHANGDLGTLNLQIVGSASVQVDGAAGVLRAISWESGLIQAGQVASLQIKGSRTVVGDLGATLDLGSLKSGKVAGTIEAGGAIHGDVGSLHIGGLSAALTIDGLAKSVQVSQSMAIMPPASGEAGVLSVGGSATVKAGAETIKFTDGQLFATEPDMYRLEDLRCYDHLGAWWQYDVTGRAFGETYTGTGLVEVQGWTTFIDGHACTSVSESADDSPGITTSWYTDAAGTHLAAWTMDNSGLTFDLELDTPLLAPEYLRLKQQWSDTGAIDGVFAIDMFGVHITGDITGQATVSSTLLGHQQLTVNGVDYLAAKVASSVVISGSMDLEYDGEVFHANFTATQTQTWWAVPDIGVLRVDQVLKVKFGVAGVGGGTDTITSTHLLTNFG